MAHRTIFGRIVAPIIDFVYPPVCPICDTLSEGSDGGICATCWESFHRLDPLHPAGDALRARFASDGSVDGFIACYLFQKEGTLQHAVHLLKYRGWKSVGVRLGREIGKRMIEEPAIGRADLIVPVPLHRLKKRERGYNQSEVLCEGIAMETGVRVERRLLRRTRYTPSQTTLDIAERRSNVAEAFAVKPSRAGEVKGKGAVLVDDVITTGATISACAAALKSAGAVRVYAAAVALAE